MSENTNERLDRYAEALVKHWPVSNKNLGYYRTEVTCACGETYWGGDHDGDPSVSEARSRHEAHAVMALADAEQAELRAEVQRLEAVADASASLAESLAERLRAAWDRAEAAEAAEAERDQARSLAVTLEARLAQVHPFLGWLEETFEGCTPSRGCTGCEILLKLRAILHPEESA